MCWAVMMFILQFSLLLFLCLKFSALTLRLSSHISDQSVMCTQDHWGTARWLLLPWQQNVEWEARVRGLFIYLYWDGRYREYVKRAAGRSLYAQSGQ